MVSIGDKLRVLKITTGKNKEPKKVRSATVHSLDKYKITVMYKEKGQDMYKESFNIADIADKSVLIDISEGTEWRRIIVQDFKGVD